MAHIISDEQWKQYQAYLATGYTPVQLATQYPNPSGKVVKKIVEPDGTVIYADMPYRLMIVNGEVVKAWQHWALV